MIDIQDIPDARQKLAEVGLNIISDERVFTGVRVVRCGVTEPIAVGRSSIFRTVWLLTPHKRQMTFFQPKFSIERRLPMKAINAQKLLKEAIYGEFGLRFCVAISVQRDHGLQTPALATKTLELADISSICMATELFPPLVRP